MQPRPDESAPNQPQASARADDGRVRELADALQHERAERLRLEGAIQDARADLHALNNVLSVVTTCAADLADEIGPDHAARVDVEEILQAAVRAGALARKLGDLQRAVARPCGSEPGHGRA